MNAAYIEFHCMASKIFFITITLYIWFSLMDNSQKYFLHITISNQQKWSSCSRYSWNQEVPCTFIVDTGVALTELYQKRNALKKILFVKITK